MGTQGPGRKRIPNREKLTAEDDALSQVAREVSDIESKIAALNAAGSKKKVSGSHQRKKTSQDFPKTTNGAQWKSHNMY